MTIRLMDPGGSATAVERSLAPRLGSLEGQRIALLTNGKHNADVLLRETAALFAERHGCREVDFFDKRNAGNPCRPDRLEALCEEADFLITAVGD